MFLKTFNKEIMMKNKEDCKYNKLGETNHNNKNCLMKIVEFNNRYDIVVEFQDKYKGRVHTNYQAFLCGQVKNPYLASVVDIGITGNKYLTHINRKPIKEYVSWVHMIKRCYDERYRDKNRTYNECYICEEWLMFENFYEWLHSQENFEKWLCGERWNIDKDILIKGNKMYSPETCCLVSSSVNSLFTKCDRKRGNLPIGVSKVKNRDGYSALCHNPFTNKQEYLGYFKSIKSAFRAYKKRKEEIIKLVAEFEFNQGNITKECYDAMMNYEVEITD